MNNKKILFVLLICMLLVVGLFVSVKRYLVYPVEITYVGELSGNHGSNCWWHVKTKEDLLKIPYILDNQRMYEKISSIDDSKYKFVISYGQPIKRLSRAKETHFGFVRYDKSYHVTNKVYIYLIKADLNIISNIT